MSGVNGVSTTFTEVKSVVITTLGVEDRADTLGVSTPLFGSLPELDSLAVLQLVHALEARFDFMISDEDITADVFETLGTLASFVEAKLR